jgi:hypothetical protein
MAGKKIGVLVAAFKATRARSFAVRVVPRALRKGPGMPTQSIQNVSQNAMTYTVNSQFEVGSWSCNAVASHPGAPLREEKTFNFSSQLQLANNGCWRE